MYDPAPLAYGGEVISRCALVRQVTSVQYMHVSSVARYRVRAGKEEHMKSAHEEATALRRRLVELQPALEQERDAARLYAVQTAIALHQQHGWPGGEDDYRERLLSEEACLLGRTL